MNDSLISQSDPSTPIDEKPQFLSSPFIPSPRSSTAPTLHHSLSSPDFQRSFSSASTTSSTSSHSWRPSSSLEIATAIPHPTFSSSAVRLTLTKPIRATASCSNLRPGSSPPSDTTAVTRERTRLEEVRRSWAEGDEILLRKDDRDGEKEGLDGDSDVPAERDFRPARFSIARRGTNPLRSHPPDPKDTIRYSIVSFHGPMSFGENMGEGSIKGGARDGTGNKKDSDFRSRIFKRWEGFQKKFLGCFH